MKRDKSTLANSCVRSSDDSIAYSALCKASDVGKPQCVAQARRRYRSLSDGRDGVINRYIPLQRLTK